MNRILFTLLLIGLSLFKSDAFACDGLSTTVTSTYIGNGEYLITVEICESISNSETLNGTPTDWATIHGFIITINGANILAINTPSVTGATSGETIFPVQIAPNQVEYGDWDNDGTPIFLDLGDPMECWTFEFIVDGPGVTVDVWSSMSNSASAPGAGMTDNGGSWGCGNGIAIPPPICNSDWTPPLFCIGSTTPFDLNTTAAGSGVFSGTGVNSGTGMFNPSGLSGNVSVTFTVGDMGFNCSTTQDIIFSDLTPPPMIDQTICAGDAVNLDASLPIATNCDYTLILDDSNGDGWGSTFFTGAADVDIYINGVLYLLNQSVSSCGGSTPCQNVITLPVNNGDIITLDYTGGGGGIFSVNNENTITILDDQGNNVGSVNNPNDGLQGTGITVSCSSISANYSWSPTTGLSNPNIANPVATPATTTTYTVDITSPDLPCPGQATVTITVDPCLNCLMDAISANVSACNPGNAVTVTGTVEYSSPPTTGQLIIEDCQGNQEVVNAPFGASYDFTLNATADGSICTITAYFTDDPTCTISVNGTYPVPCGCTVSAGTFTTTVDGVPATNNEVLCYNQTIDIISNGDYIYPGEATAPPISAPGVYAPGIGYLIYSCPPTVFPPGLITDDPCLEGVVGFGDNFDDDNNLGIPSYAGPWNSSTMYFVPITFYDTINYTYSYVNTSVNCWDMGPVIAVQYLSEITFTENPDCAAGTQTVTISGGSPEMNAGDVYTASNLTPANANFVNTTASHGGDIVIDGLVDGDVVSFDILDDNGCPLTITLAPFQGPEDPGFSYPVSPYCSADVDPSAIITGDPGSFSSTPAGLSINATSGLIDLDASTPGTYDITYTTNGTITCPSDSTISITINETPTVDPVTDQTLCVGENTTLVTFSGTPATGVTFDWVSDNTGTGVGASGTNTIAVFTSTNPSTTIQEISTITITPSTATCTGNTTSFDYIVNPLPIINAGPDASICAGGNATLNASGGNVYTWDNGLGVGNGFVVNPAVATTYIVTGVDINGCANSDTIIISVGALVPTISPNDTICVGGNSNITAGGGTSYTWDQGLGAGQNHTVFPLVTTTYTVDVSDLLCNGQASVTIVVNPLPTVVANPDITMCLGEDTIVSAIGAVNYNWDQTLGNGQTHTVSPIVTTTYLVTGTDANGCVNTDQMTITINVPPVIDAGSDQTVCPVEMITLNGAGAGIGGVYVWDNAVVDDVAFLAPGAQTTYTVIGTDVNGCVGTDQMIVSISTTPPVNAGPDTTMCIGESYVLVGTGADTYDWDQGLGIGQTHTVTPIITTQYILTGTTFSGCLGTDTVVVTINDLPIVGAGIDQTVCEGTSITLNGSGATNYQWDNGVANGVAFPAIVSQTYNVIGTDANGCINTALMNVTVNVWDDSTFLYDGSTYCVTGSDPVLNLTGTPGGAFTVTPAGLTLDGSTGAITVATSTNNTYDVTYTTSGICPTTHTLQITITNTAIADFTFAQYCLNDTDPLPTFINGGTGGAFSATPAGLTINGVTGSVDLDASIPGSYTVTNDINIPGCAAVQAQFNIDIFDLPTASISGGGTVCQGEPLPDVQFDFTGAGAWTVNYNYTGGAGNVTTSLNPYIISGAADGTYTLTQITDNSTGCSNSASGSVTVIVNPTPDVTPPSSLIHCHGDQIVIPGFNSSFAGTTFDWINLGQDIGVGMSGSGSMGITTANNLGVFPEIAIIEVTPTLNGCVGLPVQFTITVNPLPVIDVNVIIPPSCLPTSVVISNNGSPVTSCLWSFGDGTTSNTCGLQSHTYTSDGCYDITLTVSDNVGCSTTSTYPDIVCLEPNPIANFLFDPSTTDVSYTDIQFQNLSENATSYTWEFGDNSSSSNSEHPLHTYPEEPGEYIIMLVAENDLGCPDTAYSKIIIHDVLIYYVPNAFTPDNDEFNQTFKPIFTSGYDPFDYTLLIFDRWGELIFESHNTEVGWDGRFQGNFVQDGVYVWKIEFKETMTDKRHKAYGHVTIMR